MVMDCVSDICFLNMTECLLQLLLSWMRDMHTCFTFHLKESAAFQGLHNGVQQSIAFM